MAPRVEAELRAGLSLAVTESARLGLTGVQQSNGSETAGPWRRCHWKTRPTTEPIAKNRAKPVNRRIWPIIGILATGFAISLTLSITAGVSEDRLAAREFQASAQNTTVMLQSGINEYVGRIAAVRALFAADTAHIFRDGFALFVGLVWQDHSALQGISWVPRIRREERASFEAAAAVDGVADYHIRTVLPDGSLPISPEREEYFPILYSTYPLTDRVYGIDLGSEQMRRQTLERARDSGRSAASQTIELHSGQGNLHGFFVVIPVYRQDLPDSVDGIPRTVDERRRALVGFAQGAFQTELLIQNILGRLAGTLDLYVFASDPAPDSVPAYVHPAHPGLQTLARKTAAELTSAQHWTSKIETADTSWTLIALPAEGRLAGSRHKLSWTVLMAGFIATVSAATIWVMRSNSRRLQLEHAEASEIAARTDVLTGLPNRRALMAEFETALANNRFSDGSFAVLLLDLDGFKNVNDTLGHPFGDLLLKTIAQRITQVTGSADFVARLGGDEFAILQISGDQPSAAAELATRIIQAVSAPYDLAGHHVRAGVSIGVAFAPIDGTASDQLLKHADIALYDAKAAGRSVFRFFEVGMETSLRERQFLELGLRDALAKNQFELVYQPKFNLEIGDFTGAEALLRWRHPERGLISPGQFIPLAEETGLILPIGEWVLRRACADAACWPRYTTVAVNVSSLQVKAGNLAQLVEDVLSETGLAPSRLEVEVTESVFLQDDRDIMSTLGALRDLGLRIALDDFGTGYSSLSYLRKFPFDTIKIDQSFVVEMTARADCLAIVKSISSLATNLGMSTTAEGVETEEQLRQIRASGCTEVQGYYFSRPTTAAEASRLFVSNESRARATLVEIATASRRQSPAARVVAAEPTLFA